MKEMQHMADALLAAAAAASRWPRWKMGIHAVPGYIEPIEAAERWMGIRKQHNHCSDVDRFIWNGYRRKFGSYTVHLWREPWTLAKNLRKWAHELNSQPVSVARLEAAEALAECQAIMEMPGISDEEAFFSITERLEGLVPGNYRVQENRR